MRGSETARADARGAGPCRAAGLTGERLLVVLLVLLGLYFLCLATCLQGVAIFDRRALLLAGLGVEGSGGLLRAPQMLLPRPVITSSPFLPPVMFSVNVDTGTSGMVENVVTSLPC